MQMKLKIHITGSSSGLRENQDNGEEDRLGSLGENPVKRGDFNGS